MGVRLTQLFATDSPRWFIKQGAEVNVANGVRRGYTSTMTAEEVAFPRFARIVMSTLPAAQLPVRFPSPGCREVVQVQYNLTENDMEVENRQTWKSPLKKKKFWKAEFSFVVKLGPADLRFQIVGKNGLVSSDHDSLTVDFMDPSEKAPTASVPAAATQATENSAKMKGFWQTGKFR